MLWAKQDMWKYLVSRTAIDKLLPLFPSFLGGQEVVECTFYSYSELVVWSQDAGDLQLAVETSIILDFTGLQKVDLTYNMLSWTKYLNKLVLH